MGGSVQRIWRVDPRPRGLVENDLPRGEPRPFQECADPELLWDRENHLPIPEQWRCPVTYDDGTMGQLPDPWTEVHEPPAGQADVGVFPSWARWKQVNASEG